MALPLTDEFLVNSRTFSSQLQPEITTLDSGRYVITWTDFSQGFGGPGDAPIGTGIDVRAQVFEADGTRVGVELTVNSTFDRSQEIPQIAALTGGGFVIVFDDDGRQPDGGTSRFQAGTVRAQVYDDNGARIGTELIANTANIGRQHGGVPVALADGGFAVTWVDGGPNSNGSLGVGGATGDTDGWAIKMQAFDANGTPRGTEVLVNTTTAGTQSNPQATALANGNFVVTWTDGANADRRPGSAGRDDVRAQIFDSTGAKVGAEILVNTATFSDQRFQKIVALEGGGFVITWEDYSRSSFGSPGSEIVAQVFAADGSRIGAEITVNTQRQDEQEEPEIAALAGGGFVIAWIDDSPERYESGAAIPVRIKAQVFAADGTPVSSEIMVSLPAPGPNSQNRQKIAALGDGGFVIVWNSGSSDDNRDVYARTFGADGTPSSDEILVNQATEGGQIIPEVTAVGLSGFVVTWEDDSRGVGGAGGDTDRWAIKARQFGPAAETPVNRSGTDGPDLLTGTAGNDTLLGLGGNDTLEGGTGDDFIGGGTGNDLIYGGAGNDTLFGGLGNDTVDGGAGNDQIFGSAGNNQLFGGDGSDFIQAGSGGDFIGGGAGNDTVRGGDGHDTIYGGLGDDNLAGGAGNDVIFGSAGANIIWGGFGDDTVQGGSGNDTIYGGGDGTNQLFGGNGDDFIPAGSGGDLIGGGAGNDTIRGSAGADTIYGGLGNDDLAGGAGDDVIFGSTGNNIIWGGLGNDTIHVGTGKDVMNGGPGADTFVFASAAHIGIGAGRDVISGFTSGVDRIDLSALNTQFNGTAGVLGGGQASFFYFAAGGLLIGDQNGNGAADWVLELAGAPGVTAGDFLL